MVRLDSFVTLIYVLWYLAAFALASVVVIGLLRRRRGPFFDTCYVASGVYVLFVAANFYKYGELRSLIRQGDADRAALRGSEL